MTTRHPIHFGILGLCAVLSWLASANLAQAQGTAFTYQGNLTDGVAPADGTFAMTFTLKDASSGGSNVGVPESIASVDVSNGVFTVPLDFGSAAYSESDRWLEIVVNGNLLSPRQPLTPAPLALGLPNVWSVGGKVGIGTSFPATELEVAGEITASGFIGPIDGSYLATGSVSASAIASNAITTASIQNGTIKAEDIEPGVLGVGGSLWTENEGNVYRTSGNVGIGRSNPDADLMVGFSNLGSGLIDALAVYGVGDNTVGLQTILDGRNLTGYGDYGGVNNRMILQPLAGLVGIGVANPLEKLHVDGNIRCTSVVITSDRNKKDGFEEVDPREVLSKLASMEISKWHYKSETDVTHIGPMAQDFHNAFGVGPDDKHINTVDADGIALAAIQGLKEVVDEKDAKIERLEARLAAIESAMAQAE